MLVLHACHAEILFQQLSASCLQDEASMSIGCHHSMTACCGALNANNGVRLALTGSRRTRRSARLDASRAALVKPPVLALIGNDTAPDVAEVDAGQRQHVDVDDRQCSGAGLRGEEGEVEQRAPVEGSGAQLLCHDDLVRDACGQVQRSGVGREAQTAAIVISLKYM